MSGGKQTILIVDDQEDEREAMGWLLGRHGYAVETVANGQQAMARLWRDPPPALVLLDLNMPVMNGWELLANVARDRGLRDLPVVIVTGSAVADDAMMVPHNITFLTKPVRPEQVVATIARMLRPTGSPDAVPEPAALGEADTERHVVGPSSPPPR